MLSSLGWTHPPPISHLISPLRSSRPRPQAQLQDDFIKWRVAREREGYVTDRTAAAAHARRDLRPADDDAYSCTPAERHHHRPQAAIMGPPVTLRDAWA